MPEKECRACPTVPFHSIPFHSANSCQANLNPQIESPYANTLPPNSPPASPGVVTFVSACEIIVVTLISSSGLNPFSTLLRRYGSSVPLRVGRWPRDPFDRQPVIYLVEALLESAPRAEKKWLKKAGSMGMQLTMMPAVCSALL